MGNKSSDVDDAVPAGVDAAAWQARTLGGFHRYLRPLLTREQLAEMAPRDRLRGTALDLIRALEVAAIFAGMDARGEAVAWFAHGDRVPVGIVGNVFERPSSLEAALLAVLRFPPFAAAHDVMRDAVHRARACLSFRATSPSACESLRGIGMLLQTHTDDAAFGLATAVAIDGDALADARTIDAMLRRKVRALNAFGLSLASADDPSAITPAWLELLLREDWSELATGVQLECAALPATPSATIAEVPADLRVAFGDAVAGVPNVVPGIDLPPCAKRTVQRWLSDNPQAFGVDRKLPPSTQYPLVRALLAMHANPRRRTRPPTAK